MEPYLDVAPREGIREGLGKEGGLVRACWVGVKEEQAIKNMIFLVFIRKYLQGRGMQFKLTLEVLMPFPNGPQIISSEPFPIQLNFLIN